MKKYCLLGFVVVFCLVVASSCGNKGFAATESNAVSNQSFEVKPVHEESTSVIYEDNNTAKTEIQDEKSEEEEYDNQDNTRDPLVVSAVMLSDVDLIDLKDAGSQILGDIDHEYNSKLMIKVNQKIGGITLWSLESDISESGDIQIRQGSELDNSTAIDADSIVIIGADLGETLPLVGISFAEEDGTPHYYYLCMSGKDGTALITEYTPTVDD